MYAIERDGVTIELTPFEVQQIVDTHDLEHHKIDVENKAEEMYPDKEFSDKELTQIAESLENRLSKNDNYFEAFWDCVKETIKEFMED